MNTTEEKGFDAEKKDLAIKCQIALNLQEFPYAIGITKNIKLLLYFQRRRNICKDRKGHVCCQKKSV